MVAKAATKSGEFFCFHCGKQVQKQDDACKSCGVAFDRVTESFRCPRCSNLLPVGAAACPSCGLGFKVRTVGNAPKMTEDDKFLMKLIEWGKEPEDMPSPKSGVTRSVKTMPIPPPPPPAQAKPRAPTVKLATKAETKPTAVQPEKKPREMPPIGESSLDASKVSSKEARKEMLGMRQAAVKKEAERAKRPSQLSTIIDITARPKAAEPAQAAIKEQSGLSAQGFKKLLEDRDREIGELKAREEELARREEHLNRRIRSYAIKMKELDNLRKQTAEGQSNKDEAVSPGAEEEMQTRTQLLDEKEEWLKDQAKIKMGLIEIRNQIGGKKAAGEINYYPSQLSGDVVEKIEVLEEKLADISKERDDLHNKIKEMENTKQDVVTLLKVLDQLLGKLPPETIDEFSKSKDFKLYEKVLDELNI